LVHLRKLVPEGIWKHDKVDGNGDSHIKSVLVGPEKTIPIQNGLMMLGKWQAIFLAEV